MIVSQKEIPEDVIHPSEEVITMDAKSSPLLMATPSGVNGPLYVSVRTVTEDGYYSDLSEVQTLTMYGK